MSNTGIAKDRDYFKTRYNVNIAVILLHNYIKLQHVYRAFKTLLSCKGHVDYWATLTLTLIIIIK